MQLQVCEYTIEEHYAPIKHGSAPTERKTVSFPLHPAIKRHVLTRQYLLLFREVWNMKPEKSEHEPPPCCATQTQAFLGWQSVSVAK